MAGVPRAFYLFIPTPPHGFSSQENFCTFFQIFFQTLVGDEKASTSPFFFLDTADLLCPVILLFRYCIQFRLLDYLLPKHLIIEKLLCLLSFGCNTKRGGTWNMALLLVLRQEVICHARKHDCQTSYWAVRKMISRILPMKSVGVQAGFHNMLCAGSHFHLSIELWPGPLHLSLPTSPTPSLSTN